MQIKNRKGRIKMDQAKRFIKTNNGKRSRVIKYGTGKRVEIPINKDGSVRWYEDRAKTVDHCLDTFSASAISN